MIVLRLNGDKVVSYFRADASYQPKQNEVMIEAFPEAELNPGEIGRLYYRNGEVVVEIEKR